MLINYILKFIRTSTSLKNVNSIQIRQGSKSLLGDKITPLTENTLLGRMLLYLDNNYTDKLKQIDGTNIIESLIHGKTSSLRNLSTDQITSLFYSANTNLLSHNKQNLRKILELLDVECCLRINTMNLKNILKLLSAFMHVVPNRITEYKFYQYVTDDIERCLQFTSKKELMQFVFYVGLQKKTKKAQVVLRKCLKIINKDFMECLTVEDLCIICNSTYRTSTKISHSRLLEKLKQMLNDNLSLLKDPALLITLIKTIRHNRYQDEDLLNTISCTVFFNNTAQYYTFTAMCHILSLYADHLYYDENLLNLFTEKCIKNLQENVNIASKTAYLSEQPRTKDITKFLWAVSILGYKNIDQKVLKDVILPKIKERIAIGEYKDSPQELIEALLYLWILNYRAKELLPYALSQDNVAIIRDSNTKGRVRLNLLLTSIEYEDQQLFKDLKVKPIKTFNYNPNPQIQSRPLLQKVHKALKTVSSDLQLKHTEVHCQIPYLNIVGITGYKEGMKKAVNIEILDDCTCVKNKDFYPSGLMQLKLRILEQLEVPLITIQRDEIDSLTDFELKEFLEEEMKLYY